MATGSKSTRSGARSFPYTAPAGDDREIVGFTLKGKPIYKRAKRNKYGNHKTLGPTPTGGERLYDSMAEAEYARGLVAQRRAKTIASWKPQHRVPLEAEGKRICVYIVDFLVERAPGVWELHEVKGRETDVWKLKKKLITLFFLPKNPQYSLVMHMVERKRKPTKRVRTS